MNFNAALSTLSTVVSSVTSTFFTAAVEPDAIWVQGQVPVRL